MSNNLIINECTGVYEGILLENAIDTVKRVKKLYCDVYVDSIFPDKENHPLTYMDSWENIINLKKGDKVLIYFNQENYSYPVLLKPVGEIPSGFYEKFNIPSSLGISSEDTVVANEIGDDTFILKTETMTIFHQGDSCVIFKDGNTYIYGKEVVINGHVKIS